MNEDKNDLKSYFKDEEAHSKSPEKLPKKDLKILKNYLHTKELRKHYDPYQNPKTTKDPKRTLFISNLDYSITPSQLKSHLKEFGKIRDCRIVTNTQGQSRGYGFVEFKHKRDVEEAYNRGHGMRIGKRKVKVDYERARVSKEWYPMRLGGGKGGRRDKQMDKEVRGVIGRFRKGEFEGMVDVEGLVKEANTEFVARQMKRRLKEEKEFEERKRKFRDSSTEEDDCYKKGKYRSEDRGKKRVRKSWYKE